MKAWGVFIVAGLILWARGASSAEHDHAQPQGHQHAHEHHHDDHSHHHGDHDDHDHHHEGHEHHHDEQGHHHDHGHEEADHAQQGHLRSLEVSDAAAELVGLQTTKITARRIVSTKEILVRAVPDGRAARILSVPLTGVVTFAVTAPSHVKKGDELLQVASPDAAAQFGEIVALRARLEQLERNGAKNAALVAELATKEAAYAATTNGLVARAPREGRFALLSPVNGRVTELQLSGGMLADRGTSALRMTADSSPRFFGLIPVSESAVLEEGQVARVGEWEGTIRLDWTRTDGLVGVWFDLASDPVRAIRLGTTATLSIVTDACEQPVAAISEDWIFRDGLTPSVFVRDPEDADRFLVKAVETGLSANGWLEVKNLDVGTEVVSRGVYELKLALASQSGNSKRAAGHFHADGRFHEGEDH